MVPHSSIELEGFGLNGSVPFVFVALMRSMFVSVPRHTFAHPFSAVFCKFPATVNGRPADLELLEAFDWPMWLTGGWSSPNIFRYQLQQLRQHRHHRAPQRQPDGANEHLGGGNGGGRCGAHFNDCEPLKPSRSLQGNAFFDEDFVVLSDSEDYVQQAASHDDPYTPELYLPAGFAYPSSQDSFLHSSFSSSLVQWMQTASPGLFAEALAQLQASAVLYPCPPPVWAQRRLLGLCRDQLVGVREAWMRMDAAGQALAEANPQQQALVRGAQVYFGNLFCWLARNNPGDPNCFGMFWVTLLNETGMSLPNAVVSENRRLWGQPGVSGA